jgi:CubicO group peptidase (beta-lactamase class C family)
MTRIFPVTAAAITLAAAAGAMALPAASEPPGPATPPPEFSALVEAALEEHAIPALGAAYVEDGALIWAGTWGADQDALFNVASLAKPVAAETILRLTSQGQLDLDASMAEHYVDPDIAEDPRTPDLTLRIALSHMTGFPNWRWQTDGTLAFTADPGARPTYSGEGFEYAGRYTEAVTGADFGELMSQNVIDAVGATGEMSVGSDESLDARRLGGHDSQGAATEPGISETWSAADDLWTTPTGYGLFLASVMRGDDLSAELIEARDILGMDQAEMACADPAFSDFCPDEIGFALGRVAFTYGDEVFIWHGGGDSGEAAIAFYSKQTGRGLVIMANSVNGRKAFPALAATVTDNADFVSFLRMQAGG